MSFSSMVKDELVGIKTQSREERLSILCGLTHTAAAVTLGRGGLGIEYVSESENVAELAREAQQHNRACFRRRVQAAAY